MSLFVKNEKPMLFYINRFKGKKALTEIITAYGGGVCATRGLADMCLAHPENKTLNGDFEFFSTEFIADCVEMNALLDIDKYKLETNPSSPQGKERTLFSSQDHAILRQALKQTSGSPFGNTLYKEIAARHPRHSWQSWKDYALKKYFPNVDPSYGQDQENADKLNQARSILGKHVPATTTRETWNERVILVNAIPETIFKENIKKDMICEADKIRIDKYLKSCKRIFKEYDLWDHEDIMKALIMASGSQEVAKKILDSGYNLEDLDDQTRNRIYSAEDDVAITQNLIRPLEALVYKKGKKNVKDRIQFLSGAEYNLISNQL